MKVRFTRHADPVAETSSRRLALAALVAAGLAVLLCIFLAGPASADDDDDDGGDRDAEGVDGVAPTVRPGSLVASLVSGTVYVKLPGAGVFRQLPAGEVVPFGSIVNAINGRVRFSSVDQFGQQQSTEFFGGAFLVTQTSGLSAQAGGLLPVIDIRLVGGDFSGCRQPAPASGAARQANAPKARRRLWGSGRGRFRTSGRYAAATVRGTVWLTADRCDGTLIVVRQGAVSIYDRVLRRTLLVQAGHSYLARPRRPS